MKEVSFDGKADDGYNDVIFVEISKILVAQHAFSLEWSRLQSIKWYRLKSMNANDTENKRNSILHWQ